MGCNKQPLLFLCFAIVFFFSFVGTVVQCYCKLLFFFVQGDVIPTLGGGAAVVFHDVETLKQVSPGSRKRRSPTTPRYDPALQWTDTEERCSVALEGHK